MKFLIVSILSIFLILFLKSTLSAQTADTVSLNTIIAKTGQFADQYPQEKVHIHFDKPYYAVGDTIWFKAYITTGLHSLTDISKVVYVDILTRDSVVKSLKLPVNNGVAWGNIALTTENFKQGNYHVSAYTRWMLNFDEGYYFNKMISIGSSENTIKTQINLSGDDANTTAVISYKDAEGIPQINRKVSWEIAGLKGKGLTNQNGVLIIKIPNNLLKVKQNLISVIDINKTLITKNFDVKPSVKTIDLQFFPEGGELINELPSKVAFKALKADGSGIDIKGTITDNEGKIISDFASQHLGMGTVIFTPQAGKTYTATITSPLNYQGTFNLPTVKSSGITLAVSNKNTSKSILVRFICNKEFLDQNSNKSYYVVAKIGEVICYAARTVLQKQSYTAEIPRDNIPTGILQITLFSATAQPLSERLIFVQRPDALTLSLKTDKAIYKKKQNVKLTINAKNGLLPVDGNFSVAVIDETKVPFDEDLETTILSNLLLSSDLKGYIEKPNYYFKRPTDKTAADLDVLMLTQGYRRFLYQEILSSKKPKLSFSAEKGIDITGMLRNSTGMPVNKGNVKIRIPEKYFTAYTTTNGSGVFKFSNVPLTDSNTVIVSSSDYSLKNPMLTVDPVSVQPVIGPYTYPDVQPNIDSAMSLYLQNNKRIFKNSMVLNEVVIKAKATPKVASYRDYPSLSGLSALPSHVIGKERLGSCPSLLTCIRAMAPGVIFEERDFYVSRDYTAGNRTPMQVYLNGMPIDANSLAGMTSIDIESVEIFLRDELGLVNRANGTNGVLVVNSKKKAEKKQMKMEDIMSLLPKPGEYKFTPQGYTVAKEFYSPRYNSAQSLTMANDLRTTIYWNPNIKTDKATGTKVVDFFNADGRGSYRVTIEGIDADGNLGRQVFRYKVE
ncbi:MAG TPA: carboxypeptidase-like regulatory domain-containing protein [Pedobacter sp.]